MRILGVVDNDIHPPRFGGAQRSFGLLRGLARDHDVDALCVVPYRNRAPRESEVDGVRLHRRRAWYTAAAWRLEQLRLAPLAVAAYGHQARAARWLAEVPGQPDALCVGPWFGGLLQESRARLKVYLSQNVESDHFRDTGAPVFGRDGWIRRVQALEARLARHADRVVVCSDEDAARMRALYGIDLDRLIVAPNGYDETALRPPTAAERASARAALGFAVDAHVGLFLGSDAPTNRAALDWLVSHAMPRLGPDGFRLLVVGGVARALDGRDMRWIHAVPPVDDLLPLMHAADVGLNPVTIGGGSNVKVPGYLAAGLAVVTTSFGLRGYGPLAPHVVTAEIEAFADAWASRPRGWAATGALAPAGLAAYAWGDIGARLGAALGAAHAGAASAASAPAATAPPREALSGPGASTHATRRACA